MKYIKNIDNYLLFLLVAFLPLSLFWQSSYFFYQISVAIVVILAILFIKIVKIGISGKILLSTGNFDLPVLLLLISYLVSTYFISPNIYDSLLIPGTTLLLVVTTVIYFLINQLNDLKEKGKILNYLFLGVTVYSVLVLLTGVNIIPWFKNYNGYFSNVLFMTPLVPIFFSLIQKQKDFSYKFLISTALLITLFALCLSVFNIFPGKTYSPKYIPFKVSADIALGTLKSNPVFGIGAGNFTESFNKYRPYEYNASELWSNKFNQASSFILTNITEVGVFGLFSFLALVIIFINFSIKEIFKRIKVGWGVLGSLDIISAIFIFVSLIFFPTYPIQFFILFVVIGMISESKKYEFIVPSKVSSTLIALPILVLLIILSNKIYVVVSAEYNYSKSIESLSKNNAKDSFLQLKKAVKLNPGVDRYHKALSSVNFGIANALSKKKDLSSEEKDQITLFVQESINEAKAAVALNNRSSSNWEFLGKTYHLIIPFANGSDKFAVDSYKQAINLDPINPSLRISLGEVYMIKKDYKNAIESFKMATLAKDDYPNAHFNLAIAYKENNEVDLAKAELQKTMSMLEAGTKNYDLAKTEFDNISKPKLETIEPTPEPVVDLEVATDEAQILNSLKEESN